MQAFAKLPKMRVKRTMLPHSSGQDATGNDPPTPLERLSQMED